MFKNSPFNIGRVKNVKGTASRPVSTDNRTVVLFCTDTGEFEAVERNSEVSKVWEKAKTLYRLWWRSQRNFKGGEIQVEQILSDTEVAHLITCVSVKGDNDEEETYFDLNNTKAALDKLGKHCSINKTNVHINKCGTETEWDTIMSLVDESLAKRGVNVFIYEEAD